METIMIGLLAFSVLLIILSFFLKDPCRELKDEFDQFTMQTVQDIYQINRKMKILEEELLMDDQNFPFPLQKKKQPPKKKEIHAIIKNQVWSLAQQGLSIEQIARQSSLTKKDVEDIIYEFTVGGRNE